MERFILSMESKAIHDHLEPGKVIVEHGARFLVTASADKGLVYQRASDDTVISPDVVTFDSEQEAREFARDLAAQTSSRRLEFTGVFDVFTVAPVFHSVLRGYEVLEHCATPHDYELAS